MKLHDLTVGRLHLSNRLRMYFEAKNGSDDPVKISRAIHTCREWLKWAKWFQMTHAERCTIYRSINHQSGRQLKLF